MSVKLVNYGDKANTNAVDIGTLRIYFSYTTPVAFRDYSKGKLVISQNEWTRTTGKHLNMINDDKKIRIPKEDFNKELDKVLKEHGLD